MCQKWPRQYSFQCALHQCYGEARAGGSRGDPRSLACESRRVVHYIPGNTLDGWDRAGEHLIHHESVGAECSTTSPFMKFILSSLNGWSGRKCCLWKSKQEYLRPCCSQRHLRLALHLGHGNLPCTDHPMKSEYAGKSWSEYWYQTCIVKFFLLAASYVRIPFTQASFNSSTSGCMYTLIFFPGYLGPGIINDRNMCLRCIMALGGGWGEQQTRANNYMSLTPYQTDWTHRVWWRLVHSLPLLLSQDVIDRTSSMLGHKTDVSTSVSHDHLCRVLSHICAMSSVWLYLRSSKGVEFLARLENIKEHLRGLCSASSYHHWGLSRHT